MEPTTSTSDQSPQKSDVKDEPSECISSDILTKEAEQSEHYKKQLKMLQMEEKSLNSILLELRTQSRKLNLEKYRLLELCKQKQEELASMSAQDDVSNADNRQQEAFDFESFDF